MQHFRFHLFIVTCQLVSSSFAQTKNIPSHCNDKKSCSQLAGDCYKCDWDDTCEYGIEKNITCHPLNPDTCEGPKTISKLLTCAYCYQLPKSNYECSHNDSCKLGSKYRATCTVLKNVICLGHRTFQKKVNCNYSSGFRWSTTLILSIALGGFGVDRFYLGNWQEGIGKLFSFGGLGVWTLIDAILIATGYLKPGDSRYS